MILCPKCGAETGDEAAVCPTCLTSLSDLPESGRTGETRSLAPTKVTPKPQVASVTCPACGVSNVPSYLFCQKCGASLKPSAAESEVGPEPAAKPDEQPAVAGGSGAPPAAQEMPAHTDVAARLILMMEQGEQGEEYQIGDQIVIGRRNGDLTFPHDDYMSGRHARIERQGNRFILTDEGSRNGIFIKIDKQVEVRSGDLILIGKQLFRFET